MSRKSYDSAARDKRLSKHRVSDDDLFSYALRVAFISHQLTRKKDAQASTPTIQETKERETQSRITHTISNSMYAIADIFKDRDGSKSVKFPEKMLKVLEQKLESIAMGKEPQYSGQFIRRSMAVFYGQFKNETFKRQMKENRKIEELIMIFASNATTVLKKDPALATGDKWLIELNSQITTFVKLLGDCLNSMHHVGPELLARLEYASKLTPAEPSNASTKEVVPMTTNTVQLGSQTASVSEMALAKSVGQLFGRANGELQKALDQIRPFCTERAALNDLKTCIKNINAGAPFPGRREDFESDQAWQSWRKSESAALQQLIVALTLQNPELAKSAPSDAFPTTPRPGSLYSPVPNMSRHTSVSSRFSLYDGAPPPDYVSQIDAAGDVEADDDIVVGHNFTYIPPSPKKYYKRLLEICLTADLERIMSPDVDEGEEVPMGILSGLHLDLLNECALRWRIDRPFRVTSFLDLVKSFYERLDVPLEFVTEALQEMIKVLHETDLENWSISDVDFLATTYGALFSIVLSALYHVFEAIPNLKPAEIEPLLFVLEHVQESGLLQRFDVDIHARLADVQDRVRQVAIDYYDHKMGSLLEQPGVNKALPLLLMTDDLEKTAKNLDKKFPSPLLGSIDLVSLVVEVQVPRFLHDVQNNQKRLYESSMNGPTPDIPIQDIFALYRRTMTMMEMFAAYCEQSHIDFDISAFFEPYVRQWLSVMDGKTGQWVEAAIAADKFQTDSSEGHSSSIVDLFDSLRSPINVLQDLGWSNEYQNARFFTALAKSISKAIELYCRNVEDLFMNEMFPRPTDYIQPQKSSAWLEKAKEIALSSEKKVEPFNFKPESCVKLNNVEASRKLLDNMYNQMQADKLGDIIREHGPPPVPDKEGQKQRYLFAVKVVFAEGLVPLDGSFSTKLDTFVTLSDEQGNRLAKTRTIYETASPRWDETFDMSIDKPLWLMISVRDRSLIGKHDIIGREYICLDPRKFGDLLAHDVWKNLDTSGRILLRISMEGEKDDIQFYFGRAFRSLKRAEGDMLRIFIDKMSPFIRQCLSRSVLYSLVGTGTTGLEKRLKGVTDLLSGYQSTVLGTAASEVLIPLPQSEKPRHRPDELTDVQIEAAILPLFDYFDANLRTLNTYLSKTALEMVMTRVWKEILNVIEGLLIPPLSDTSCEMKPLSDKEVDIVFKWLKFLRDYFYINGEGPLPLEILQNQKYRDVVSIRLYYDMHTDALMEECVRAMQTTLRSQSTMTKRVKSVYNQRNLGTIKERKKDKKEEKESSGGEIIMRILRMRNGTQDFIGHQLQIMNTMQAEREQRSLEVEKRKLARPSRAGRGGAGTSRQSTPPVPPLPSPRP